MMPIESTLEPRPSAGDLWADMDGEILRHLRSASILSTSELAGKLGVSDTAMNSFLALLVLSGKVRIRVVELDRAPLSVVEGPASAA